MNLDSQLKLQAYLDGELSPRDARQAEAWLAEDREANLLADDLRNTKALLAGHDSETKVPETREFYWRKIESQISNQRDAQRELDASSIFLAWCRRFLVPASAVAALLVFGFIVTKQYTLPSISPTRLAENQARHFPEFESPSESTRGFTFRDHSTGMSLVWITYRDDKGFTDEGLVDTVQ